MDELLELWRNDAATLRKYAATTQADSIEQCAAQLSVAMREYALEALTLEAAVIESGYSYSSLQKRVASGELENAGSKGRPLIVRGQLPKKGKSPAPGLADHDLFRRLSGR